MVPSYAFLKCNKVVLKGMNTIHFVVEGSVKKDKRGQLHFGIIRSSDDLKSQMDLDRRLKHPENIADSLDIVIFSNKLKLSFTLN